MFLDSKFVMTMYNQRKDQLGQEGENLQSWKEG